MFPNITPLSSDVVEGQWLAERRRLGLASVDIINGNIELHQLHWTRWWPFAKSVHQCHTQPI